MCRVFVQLQKLSLHTDNSCKNVSSYVRSSPVLLEIRLTGSRVSELGSRKVCRRVDVERSVRKLLLIKCLSALSEVLMTDCKQGF